MNSLKSITLAGALAGLSLLTAAAYREESLPTVWLANDVVGMKVFDAQGASVGRVEDIIVREGSFNAYAVLTLTDGVDPMNRYFALPWSVVRKVEADTMKKGSKRSLVVSIPVLRIKSGPHFNRKSWPAFAENEWSQAIDDFYLDDLARADLRPEPSTTSGPVHTWRISDLKGDDIHTAEGKELGEIDELAIDRNGRVVYATTSVGGFLGMGDRVVAIPWGSLKFVPAGEDGSETRISIAHHVERIDEAPEFKSSNDDRMRMCDEKFITSVYAHFSCPIYWTLAESAPRKTPVRQ